MLVLLLACAPATSEAQLPAAAATPNLLLLIHGGGDDPSVWADAMGEAAAGALADPSAWTVLAYDWHEAAASSMSAAPNGEAEGAAMAPRLVGAGFTHVHLLAHSVGGMVVDGLLGALPAERDFTVHATFLDPFCFLDLGQADYGNRHFGEGADFAESYLNTDDPAPSTSEPLDHAHTFDVTGVRPDSVDAADGHRWPITWYQSTWTDGELGAALSAERTGAFDPGLAEAWPAGEETTVGE